MIKQRNITKTISMVLIVGVILLSACAPDTNEVTSQDTSTPEKSVEATSGDISKTADDTSDGVMTIYADLFKEHTKGPVKLNHDKHAKSYSTGCNECHHIYENGKNVWKEGMEVKKCQVCHNEPTVKKEKSLPLDLQKKNLKLAFHNNCRTCHRKVRADDPDTTAPTTCSGCHQKKE